MRTPDRILHETWLENGSPIKMDQEKRAWITIAKKAIIIAQTEALKASAEHAKVKFIHDPDNFKTGGYYVVDQDSILKLMK